KLPRLKVHEQQQRLVTTLGLRPSRPSQIILSGFDIENWSIKCLSRARGIEIFAKESDFPSGRSQKQHIVLTVNAPCRLDESLCLDFGDGRFRFGKIMNVEIEIT